MFDNLPSGKWWDIGLQLVEGCTKVSPACDHCWSLAAANMRRYNPNPKMAARYEGTIKRAMIPGAMMRPEWTGRVNLQWGDLDKIGRARTPKVYTFWNDLFHPGVPDEFVDEVMVRITGRMQHFYIICTKRPERALKFYSDPSRSWVGNDYQQCLMLMTTVENQAWADRRIPVLLQIPGVLHGVSLEPMLGPLNFRWAKWQQINAGMNDEFDGLRQLDWIIVGGETGPQARPMHPDWPCKVRDQAQAAGVPCFFKHWGEWAPRYDARNNLLCIYDDGRTAEFYRAALIAEEKRSGKRHGDFDPTCISHVGRKAAGRLLDGREWNEVPHVMPQP